MKDVYIKREVVILFTETISALLSSGLSIQDALTICAKVTTNKRCAELCKKLHTILHSGQPLHRAISFYESSFTPLYISLVRLGEKTGSIDSVFKKLNTYLQQKKDTKSKIIHALIYPVTVVITAFAVSFFIVLYVFPRVQDIFIVLTAGDDTGKEALEAIYVSIFSITLILSAITFCVVFTIYLYKTNISFRIYLDRFFISFPPSAKILKSICTNDFSFSMELLLSAGIPLVESLKQAGSVVLNKEYAFAVDRVADCVLAGSSLSDAFRKENVFPLYIVQWVGIGESTGNAHGVFNQIHSYYERENNLLLRLILQAIEPIFILIAGIILLLLVVQFVLPIFSLLGGVY